MKFFITWQKCGKRDLTQESQDPEARVLPKPCPREHEVLISYDLL